MHFSEQSLSEMNRYPQTEPCYWYLHTLHTICVFMNTRDAAKKELIHSMIDSHTFAIESALTGEDRAGLQDLVECAGVSANFFDYSDWFE